MFELRQGATVTPRSLEATQQAVAWCQAGVSQRPCVGAPSPVSDTNAQRHGTGQHTRRMGGVVVRVFTRLGTMTGDTTCHSQQHRSVTSTCGKTACNLALAASSRTLLPCRLPHLSPGSFVSCLTTCSGTAVLKPRTCSCL
jgi:hypothetical protein